MKKTVILTIASLALVSSGLARTWTSADGSQTFEGDLISCSDELITVKRGRKNLTFKLERLSEKDQAWAKVEGKKLAAAADDKKAAADFTETDFGKALKDLKKLEGNQFVSQTLENPPKFFLLYFSASW